MVTDETVSFNVEKEKNEKRKRKIRRGKKTITNV